MRGLAILAGLAVAGFSLGADAAEPAVPFEEAVYLTCQEVHQMPPQPRVDLVRQLAAHAGQRYGVQFRDNDKIDTELAAMIRAGCTMFPNASVFFIVSAAVKAEAEALRPKSKK